MAFWRYPTTTPNCNLVKVESELINLDIKSFGAKSLPDSSLIRKNSHLDSPLVLQVTSAKDVLRSSIDNSSLSSHSRRLLRLRLTDGHYEIIAIVDHEQLSFLYTNAITRL